MKSMIKGVLKRALPRRLVAVISSRRWWTHVANAQGEHKDLCRLLISHCGTAVMGGPFKGLRYNETCLLSHGNTQLLLGTYEIELHPWLEQVLSNKYERIVDIGAAEGYYAVGMAMRTATVVDAYETAGPVRRMCREMARLNGVNDLVRVHSWCDSKTLRKLNGRRCLILSDCEGYETELFTTEIVPAIAQSDLIIELHDRGQSPGTTRRILENRLCNTHSLSCVRFGSHDVAEFPQLTALSFLSEDDVRKAISEAARDADQEWMFAIPKR